MRSGGAVLVEAAGGAAMLPLPFACRGEVVRGFGRGSRQLGVPTGEGLFAWQLSFLFFISFSLCSPFSVLFRAVCLPLLRQSLAVYRFKIRLKPCTESWS